MIFSYKGVDAKGKRCSGQIEARNMDEAKQRLKAKGIIYTSVKPIKNRTFNLQLGRGYRLKPKELSVLSRDIAIFLRAGIPLIKALALLQNQYSHHKKIYNFLQTVITAVDEGKTFYQALEQQSIVKLPPFYKQAVKVAEENGILDEVLLKLADFVKERDRINKQIQGAFAYPMFIVVASIGMVIFMIAYVVPKITKIFVQMGQELPATTRFVVATGDFFSAWWPLMLTILVGSIVFFALLYHKSAAFKHSVDRMMLTLPFFGSMIQKNELGKFSYMASMLVKSGVPFVQAIKLSAQILNNSVIRQTFLDAADRVVEGKRLSAALNMEKRFRIDPSFVQAIAVGEETSEVSPILQNLSELYFEENKDRMEVVLSLLEPALMLIVGGIIGFIITAMLLPIFSINIQ